MTSLFTEKEQHSGRAAIDGTIRFFCYDRNLPHCISLSHTLGHCMVETSNGVRGSPESQKN